MWGLWAMREGTRLFVGSGTEGAVRTCGDQWGAAGWRTELKDRVRGRRTLREPYEPLSCSRCHWAGLNLGVHHARAHPDTPRPDGDLVAGPVRVQARNARSAQDRNRRPRAGLLVVESIAYGVALTYRVERVTGDGVTLVPLAPVKGQPPGVPFTVPEDEALSRFRPVGRWVGR